jgi:glycerol-3-phosphate dehydrogenase
VQVEDIEGVELCGTLKNVVAIAAGMVYTSSLVLYVVISIVSFQPQRFK